ncbi:M20/M25/M40 family metallo-hydrolase [Kaistella sp. G5-32]|uniref:M20/M25/M40 family metallo-hydrolase n=1 Tax=Kaistella gelatinilytica TaxID=2787636 RepID=A0ABS0F851_9FLAO|nr:M28 family peptidase [Kaistella gelatinilytica]MBF8455878.1 M20/M25/M40 family metallo-hydrolase [Kaistella gelatinilytica]
MNKFLLISGVVLSSVLHGQAVSSYQDRVNLIKQDSIIKFNTELVNIGVKKSGSTQNANALAYLTKKYKDFGYTASQITNDTYKVFTTGDSKSIIVTKTGTTYPNEYVIICGHYDTFSTTGSNISVGANDNESGVSAILEIARILKDVPTEYSIKFINFSGEEQGLYGSKSYVSQVVNATNPKMKIRLVFNLDQVGGMANKVNNTVTCEADRFVDELGTVHTAGTKTTNDAASLAFTNSLVQYVGYYSSLTGALNYAYSSDYIPFENNGEIITGFYERPTSSATINTNYNNNNVVSNTYYHNNTDTIANLSYPYLFQITKSALGAMQHFSVASISGTLHSVDTTIDVNEFFIHPNPAKDFINLLLDSKVKNYGFEISDMSGQLISKTKNKERISVSSLKPGVYIGTLDFNNKKTSKKFIVR